DFFDVEALAAAVVRAGVSLAAAADELAERSGLGRVLVGALLLALATSLPELLTDASATLAGAPDLAVADLFGASMANMGILALCDIVHRGRVWPSVELGHARVAAVAIALTAGAGMSIAAGRAPELGWVGLDTGAIAAAYLAAAAWFHRTVHVGASRTHAPARELQVPTGWSHRGLPVPPLAASARRFGAAAAAMAVAAPVLALAAREVAAGTGVAQTAIGVGLLAVTTSLPELVASLAAVRMGAHDLAVGNLFGTNAANMSLLVVLDALYTRGPILAAVDDSQLLAVLGGILLMALALAAIVTGTETRVGRLEPDATVLLIVYVVLLVVIGAAS
ncbi:MAG: hypothetical protein C4344_01985, partial [Acidimicrobiia bacterium]